MRDWLFCTLELLVYTFGVAGVCALIVEQCHRAVYALLGSRAGRIFWYVTALPGVPVHELGHALLCPVFLHRIEHFYCLPSRRHTPCVEHSYDRRNPYAALGNLFIGLGPILSGLALMLAILHLLFPQAAAAYTAALSALQQGATTPLSLSLPITMLHALFTESATPVWLLPIGWYLLLSLSMHVRLSVADLRGMAPGIPWAVLLAASIAAVITLLGQDALAATTLALQRYALFQSALLALILFFSLFSLAFAAVLRMFRMLVRKSTP